MNGWESAVLNSFIAVMKRPRFEVQFGEVKTSPFNVVHSFSHLGSNYELVFTLNRNTVTLEVRERPHGKFKFQLSINRSNPPKIRKNALIMMKKLQNKPIFDALKA